MKQRNADSAIQNEYYEKVCACKHLNQHFLHANVFGCLPNVKPVNHYRQWYLLVISSNLLLSFVFLKIRSLKNMNKNSVHSSPKLE